MSNNEWKAFSIYIVAVHVDRCLRPHVFEKLQNPRIRATHDCTEKISPRPRSKYIANLEETESKELENFGVFINANFTIHFLYKYGTFSATNLLCSHIQALQFSPLKDG
jgi:hypothetical protein